MKWWPRSLVAMALAAITGGALVLERRRFRRRRPSSDRGRSTDASATAAEPASVTEEDDDADKPLLSPTRFTLSHFSMLFVLTAMMVTGLAMRGIRRYPPPAPWHVPGGDVERGRLVIEQHGCGGCHSIRGIRSATGQVGPPLEGFAQRMYIGGQLPNTPEHLVAWLQDPQRYAPGTAMPKMPINESVARDMAAYLYTQH